MKFGNVCWVRFQHYLPNMSLAKGIAMSGKQLVAIIRYSSPAFHTTKAIHSAVMAISDQCPVPKGRMHKDRDPNSNPKTLLLCLACRHALADAEVMKSWHCCRANSLYLWGTSGASALRTVPSCCVSQLFLIWHRMLITISPTRRTICQAVRLKTH